MILSKTPHLCCWQKISSRGWNNSWLPAKTGKNYYLADSGDVIQLILHWYVHFKWVQFTSTTFHFTVLYIPEDIILYNVIDSIWIKLFYLMVLVSDFHFSPYICQNFHSSWFKYLTLPQPDLVHEGWMTSRTLSWSHFDVIKWNQKALLKELKTGWNIHFKQPKNVKTDFFFLGCGLGTQR